MGEEVENTEGFYPADAHYIHLLEELLTGSLVCTNIYKM